MLRLGDGERMCCVGSESSVFLCWDHRAFDQGDKSLFFKVLVGTISGHSVFLTSSILVMENEVNHRFRSQRPSIVSLHLIGSVLQSFWLRIP